MRKSGTRTRRMIGMAICMIAVTFWTSWSWRQNGGQQQAAAQSVSPAGSFRGAAPSAAERDVDPLEAWRRAQPLPARNAQRREFTARRPVAGPSPPVADRLVPDPSLAETPSLPTVEPPNPTPPPAVASADSREPEGPAVASSSPQLARRSIEQTPDIAACWPLPLDLVDQLEVLREQPQATRWVERVGDALQSLHRIDALSDKAADPVLEELAELASAAKGLAASVETPNERARLLRAGFSLERRLAVWRAVQQLAAPTMTQVSLRDYDASTTTQRLVAVEQQLSQLANANAWRTYFLLDQVGSLAAQRWSACADQRSQLAREILCRLEAADASVEQERFFAQPAWQEFADELREWVSEPVDYEALLDDVERLEQYGTEEAARCVAGHYQLLRWSPVPQAVQLGDVLNTYYRNANLRLAISGDLLNRLLPRPQPVEEDVNDTLMGGRIFGRSRVSTRLRLVLFPDRQKWNMGLEAHGDVDSQTETKHGPAVFHNAGRSRYLARKLLLIDRRGIRTEAAEAAAVANNDLTRVETDLDGVPLVNLMARAIARQQYDSKSEAARWQAEGLVANRAETRLDEEVDRQLDQATEQFRERVLKPLHDLGLRPEAVDMQTTEQRLIARYRLAGYEQLGAFTPRPQAPAESLLSVQIHESMLNNTVYCLHLNGRESDLPTLFRDIAARFHRDDYQVPADVPQDVTITLADRDPITFTCSDDRIHLTLRIAKLASQDEFVWRNFEVRASYAPNVDGLHLYLLRDGYIRLKAMKGRGLSFRDQIALRGIFSKVLAEQPDIDLLGNILVRDKRLHDLRIIQFVLRDGWIGLAIGNGQPVKFHIADSQTDERQG